jgi:hypothetical protein
MLFFLVVDDFINNTNFGEGFSFEGGDSPFEGGDSPFEADDVLPLA